MHERARIFREIREFFHRRDVLEVHTPIVSSGGIFDPAIENIQTTEGRYLQASPEFQMKRLLAWTPQSIYQIAPAFRDGENGRWHNPEFILLEWYRPGFGVSDLITEVRDLVDHILGSTEYATFTVQTLLDSHFGIDYRLADEEQLRVIVDHIGLYSRQSRKDMLDFLIGRALEETREDRVFITEYPPELAALARISERGGSRFAERFELVVSGIELANGYNELLNADELVQRVVTDSEQKQLAGLPEMAPDSRLINAMKKGLPQCAGVALGLDRLVALALHVSSIGDVMAFPWDCA